MGGAEEKCAGGGVGWVVQRYVENWRCLGPRLQTRTSFSFLGLRERANFADGVEQVLGPKLRRVSSRLLFFLRSKMRFTMRV